MNLYYFFLHQKSLSVNISACKAKYTRRINFQDFLTLFWAGICVLVVDDCKRTMGAISGVG